ncbi:MAG: putative ABC transporter permease [Bacilli bacterium]|nr:putative ABC transporter permease [Bacilli bacterium]
MKWTSFFKFSDHIPLIKLFWIFLLGSIFGAYYEQIVNVFIHYHYHHELVWQLRRGLIYGPISPLYGAGAVLFTLFLVRKESCYKTFLKGALLGGFFEYFMSFFQELFFGTISWDYSGDFLNLNGRTTIPFMVVWGLLAVIFVRVIYPFLEKLIESYPIKFRNFFTVVCFSLLVLDFGISWGALIRQHYRAKAQAPFTIIGTFLDRYYNDDVLKKYYENMKVIEVIK